MKKTIIPVAVIAFVLGFLLGGAVMKIQSEKNNSTAVKPEEKSPVTDEKPVEDFDEKDLQTAYFAGGCFWGMERFMNAVPGVVDVVSGYANGDNKNYDNPSYDMVLSDKTGYKEAVKVTFEPSLSYEMLVRAYFIAIDPTVENRQANDIGTQYQTGIFYLNDEQEITAVRVSNEIRKKVDNFAVIIEPLKNFYDAEGYHQDYLEKNPNGYCHISDLEIMEMKKLFSDREMLETYERPDDKEISGMLNEVQYKVTQENATEAPFNNEFWDHFEKGLYIDIISKEPLFTSEEKYDSSCGWPAFYDTHNTRLKYVSDFTFNATNTEVRSGAGDTHLGHVFTGDEESPNGTRFCINSASLEFIPYDEIEERGYGYTLEWFNKDNN